MEVKNSITAEPIVDSRVEWKILSAKEALGFFQQVIPKDFNKGDKKTVLEEKVTFVDNEIYGEKEEGSAIAFVSSLGGQNRERLKLSWARLSGGGNLECEEPINMAHQEVEGKKYVLISQKGTGEKGEKLEIIRRFSLQNE